MALRCLGSALRMPSKRWRAASGCWSFRSSCARLAAAGKKAGELSWELPLIQEYKKGYMKGPAHIKNSGSGSMASTICGALFIEDFVKKTKWAHMDIAFTNWADQPGFYYSMEGATGAPVRTMVNFLFGF